MAKSGWNWETIFTTVTQLASKATEFGEKRKIRATAPFKFIQGH